MAVDHQHHPELPKCRRIGGWALGNQRDNGYARRFLAAVWLMKGPDGTDAFPAAYRLALRDNPKRPISSPANTVARRRWSLLFCIFWKTETVP